MTRKRVTDVAASVRARLLNISRETRSDLVLVLRRYAIERLLARISRSPFSEQFVLKGAMLFAAWGWEIPRPTKDLDLLGLGESSPGAAAAVFKFLCAMPPEPPDGLVFQPSSVRAVPIREDRGFNGVRVVLEARLGRARIPLQVDIGFNDEVSPQPLEIEYPSLLGAPRPHLRAYRPETAIAEKTDAIVSLGMVNSRMKDFFDIWTLSLNRSFEGAALYGALAATLKNRGNTVTRDWPVCFTDDFYGHPGKQVQWSAFLRKNGLGGTPEDFTVIGKKLVLFLAPVYRAVIDNRQFSMSWSPERETWL